MSKDTSLFPLFGFLMLKSTKIYVYSFDGKSPPVNGLFQLEGLLRLVMLGVPNSLFCQKKIGFLVKCLL